MRFDDFCVWSNVKSIYISNTFYTNVVFSKRSVTVAQIKFKLCEIYAFQSASSLCVCVIIELTLYNETTEISNVIVKGKRKMYEKAK